MVQFHKSTLQPGLVLSLISILFISNIVQSQEAIQDANNSFYSLNLDEATQKYSSIFEDETASDRDRIRAASKLIYIAWHFDQNIINARGIAKKAIGLTDSVYSIYPEIIRNEAAAFNFKEAKDLVDLALFANKTERIVFSVYSVYADLVLQESVYRLERGMDLNQLELTLALNRIKEVNEKDPGRLKPARLQLGLALLLKDGKPAMESWRTYYHLTPAERATGLLSVQEVQLNRILPSWQGNALTEQDKVDIVKCLAGSRFYDLAYLLILLHDDLADMDDHVHDIKNYYLFTQQIDSLTDAYYRHLSISGLTENDLLEKSITAIQKELWENLSWEGRIPKYTENEFLDTIYERFGTKIYAGEYNDTHYYIGGHTIVDTLLKIEQYNHTLEVPYYELDHRFSNNYWGWFTGYMGFAGYGSNRIIVRYREPAAEMPISYWLRLTDPVLRANWQELIAKETENEMDPDAGENELTGGVYNRILYSTLSGILDSLRRDHANEHQVRLKFLHVINEIMIKSNINHEGRHAIDFSIMKRKELSDGARLEYRALLSQIYFSDFPLFEIRFDIDESPHGRANKQILTIISDWMIDNQQEIEGFDPEKSPITQIDLLSNRQLKAIMRSNDPIAN